jgi:hypothetical protein
VLLDYSIGNSDLTENSETTEPITLSVVGRVFIRIQSLNVQITIGLLVVTTPKSSKPTLLDFLVH